MPSEKEIHPVLSRYQYDRETDKSKCLIDNCSSNPMKGKHVGNLVAHLNRYHKEEFELVKEEQKAISVRKQQESRRAPPRKRRKVETSIAVRIDKARMMEACVSLVADSGRPLKLINDPGMRMILDPILEGLESSGSSLTLSPATVSEDIKRQAAELRKTIKKQIGNRLICVKVDGAKRLSRAIVGINIQYIEDGKIQLRNLASVELKDRQTGIALKKIVKDVASEYGIPAKNFYTATTDNGANIVLAVKLLAAELEKTASASSTSSNESEGCSVFF